jgi:hypothetical protein
MEPLNPPLAPESARTLHFAKKDQVFVKKRLEAFTQPALDGGVTGF